MFIRSKSNPILTPNTEHDWEAKKLYNPGAIFHDGQYHLFYRAIGNGEDWQSVIGHAVSADGEHFERFDKPLLKGEKKSEKRGLEDPRITKIGDTFYMAYAAYDGITPRLSIATSKDLWHWKKRGPVFRDWQFNEAGGIYNKFIDGQVITKPKLVEWSKSGGIFPEKINDKFLMLFGEYRIWFAKSEDGFDWDGDQKPFLEPRPGDYFDNTFVEMGPPPIKTELGWLILYHGVNHKQIYRIGYLLLDLMNPRKIICRSEKPIFEPIEQYETSGIIDVLPGGLNALQKMSEVELKEFLEKIKQKGNMPQVTFCCGAVVIGDTLRIYYGAGDSVICTATTKLSKILKEIEREQKQ